MNQADANALDPFDFACQDAAGGEDGLTPTFHSGDEHSIHRGMLPAGKRTNRTSEPDM
jgi:hypothetical protein